jgi:hypothetical protein
MTNAVVSNDYINGAWGNEQRNNNFPFRQHQPFDVLILVETSRFRVSVENQYYATFNNRLQLHFIDVVNVVGDVQLHSIVVSDASPTVCVTAAP